MDLKERYLTLLKSIGEILKNENQMHISSIKKKMDIILEDCIKLENEISKEKEWEVGGSGLTEEDKQEINNSLLELKSKIDNQDKKIDENSSQIDEIENSKANKSDLTNAFNFKGSIEFSNLPLTDNSVNDTYYVTDKGMNYSWNGVAWFESGSVDTIPLNSITEDKLKTDIKERLDRKINNDDYAYIISDKNKRVSVAIKKNGNVHFFSKTEIENINTKNINNEKFITNKNIIAGTVDKSGRLAENVIDKSGRVPDWVLEAWSKRFPITEEFKNSLNSFLKENLDITCWGDSLTAGVGTTADKSYPSVLSNLTGIKVKNRGASGDDTLSISCMQGGLKLIVNDIIIPSSKDIKVEIANKDKPFITNTGENIAPGKQAIWHYGKPCIINGVKGVITVEYTSLTSDDWKYYFSRNEDGEEININRPTIIETTGALENKDSGINIIWMGQNGGWNNDVSILISQIKRMLSFATSDKYLVLSVPSGTTESRKDYDNKMALEFGRNYINVREYMSKYGLSDLGLTPTTSDLEEMEKGSIPGQLRADSVHWKAETYKLLVTNLIIPRLKELNYI